MSDGFPTRPDLTVIDRAIRRLRNHDSFYSCWAMRVAATGSIWNPETEYERQFALWMCKRGPLPKWWGSRAHGPQTRARIAALKSFRQACIDAAIQAPGAAHQPTQPEGN